MNSTTAPFPFGHAVTGILYRSFQEPPQVSCTNNLIKIGHAGNVVTSKKMGATNNGFNGHPILHLFLLSNLLELLNDGSLL